MRGVPHVLRRGSGLIPVTIAGLTCALLTGCVEIPSDGPVLDAQRVEGGRDAWIQVYPAGPSSTATPADLVLEFLRASADPTNDHEVARRFLQQQQQFTWRPESPVVVRDDGGLTVTVTRNGITELDPGNTAPASPTPPVSTSGTPTGTATGATATGTATGATAGGPAGAGPSPSPTSASASVLSAPPRISERARVTVRAPVQARIDQAGRYTVAGPRETEVRSFDLVGTELGWRIIGLDQGVMITRDELNRTFRAMPLYFADPMGDYLVPDVRWFAATTALPSQAVTALLAGPQDWLLPSVVSGAPPGTALTVNAVKIVDGVATVDLTKEAWGADARQRVTLKAQFERTLAAVGPPSPQVTTVVITVEQQKFELQPTAQASGGARGPGEMRPGSEADGAGGVRLRTPPPVDAQPVVLDAHGAIARLGVKVEPVPGLEALAGAGSSDPAMDSSGQSYAVLTAGRTRLLYAVPSGQATALMAGHNLVAPSFDPFSWVWTSQEDCRGVLLAGRPGVGVAKISAGWLQGWKVRSLRISREGARVALVAQPPGGVPQALVASIIRNAQGMPMALAPPVRLLADGTDVSSAAWMDATHVVVLGRRPGSVVMPWIVEIGGDLRGTIPVQAVAVTVGNTESELYVRLAGGGVRVRAGSTWIDVPGVRYPAMPG